MAEPISGPISVLIVDDHPVVRQGLRVLLEVQDGIEVVGEVGDGRAALALAAERAPDVILLDLKLPGLDGLAVLAKLQGDPELPGRPELQRRPGHRATTGICCWPRRRPALFSTHPAGRDAGWTPSPLANARSWPNLPTAAPTAKSPAPCTCRRRRSRPTSARCWLSSACRTERKRRSWRYELAWKGEGRSRARLCDPMGHDLDDPY